MTKPRYGTLKLGILSTGILLGMLNCESSANNGDAGPGSDAAPGQTAMRAGASVHYYYYQGYGMLRCPGRVPGYTSQSACDALGLSQTQNGTVNQVGLTCDSDPSGCIVNSELLVTATDRCPQSARSVKVTYKTNSVQVRIVDRTPGNGGFDLGLDPYIDLGIYDDFQIGVTGPQDISYECMN